MLKTIVEASENFCIHQIRLPYEINDDISKKRTLIAYIDINRVDDRKFRVYLACEINFMQRVIKLFLEEDKSDEDTLKNMTLETVNLIVGSAKVIASKEDENPYTISTPHFEKIDKFNYDYDKAKSIKVADDKMIIAIKEIDV